MAVALVLAMATWFSATAVIPQLRAEWALSDSAAAWLTISVQIGFVIGALVSSIFNIADVVSPRAVILGGAVGAAAANAGLLLASDAGLAVPARLATGFFLAGVYPPALKLMSTWFRRGRGLALGILVGALTVGSALPHLVNGLGGLDWRIAVGVTSAITVVGGVIAVTVKPGPFPFPKAVFDARQIGRAFANRSTRLASFGYFGHMWELYAMWAWFLVFFRAYLGDPTGQEGTGAAYATFLVIGSGAIGCVLGGILGDRWGRAKTTASMMAVSGACALVIGFLFGSPIWIVVLVGVIWGITVVGDSAQFSTIVTEKADQVYVGTALTLQLALGFTLTVVTIWLIPMLQSEVGWRLAFAFLTPGPALGIVAMLRLGDHDMKVT